MQLQPSNVKITVDGKCMGYAESIATKRLHRKKRLNKKLRKQLLKHYSFLIPIRAVRFMAFYNPAELIFERATITE